MASRAEKIEELLWDLDEYYPESEILDEAWEVFNYEGDLPNPMLKKLKRMLNSAMRRSSAA